MIHMPANGGGRRCHGQTPVQCDGPPVPSQAEHLQLVWMVEQGEALAELLAAVRADVVRRDNALGVLLVLEVLAAVEPQDGRVISAAFPMRHTPHNRSSQHVW